MDKRVIGRARVIAAAIALLSFFLGILQCPALAIVKCADQTLPQGGNGQDLQVTGHCKVMAGLYEYGDVNIFGTRDKPASLEFEDQQITFWAHSILVENHGSLLAGACEGPGVCNTKPIGSNGGHLEIYLYGAVTDAPISCKSPGGTCGVDPTIWNSNANPARQSVVTMNLPGSVNDYFYNYNFMPFGNGADASSFFGSKVLAVSFGGTLKLFGAKGATYSGRELSKCKESDASCSGTSWVRLQGSLKPGDTSLTLDGLVDWQPKDHIVVTTTDYMPGHSEELVIQSVTLNTASNTTTISFTNADGVTAGVKWHHNGAKYELASKGVPTASLGYSTVETRAAVALLTRSIEILSGGDSPEETFPGPDDTAKPYYSFGGHTVARQGFKLFQMQGVELYQLGQGGQIMHYPVHFHMARKTPANTFVKDCSIHDSMTRWITIHATQGVTLARNVGYLSIGHGYYLEDGTEANNKFYSNIGIFARAAVDNKQNPRKVPGILAANSNDNPGKFPYHSDTDNPTVFWIMNGWNDFEYNMAAGAGTCGSCYWLVPGYNSNRENTSNGQPNSAMKWLEYPAMQRGQDRAGMTPLEKFVGNSCTSAMNSFQTVGEINLCHGVGPVNGNDVEHIAPIANPSAPPVPAPDPVSMNKDIFYPRVIAGASRPATRCGDDPARVDQLDCGSDSVVLKCGSNGPPPLPPLNRQQIYNCMVTVLDDYTTSFNWADTNFAAVWLRQFWYLFINSAITDVQNGGLTFVTGGDYTRSSVIDGYWSVAKKSVFIGHTQKDVSEDPQANPYASVLGPFNPGTGLKCPINDPALNNLPNHCVSKDDGISLEVANFATNQRFFNIYDGPSYEDTNALWTSSRLFFQSFRAPALRR